jgi:hypothetical protein
MSIEATLRQRLTAAIKARDLKTANVIRMVNTKVMERRTAKDFKGEVDDALILDVIAAYRKSLLKARTQFEQAGERGKESIAELDFEVGVLDEYLPKGLGEAELRAAVRAAIAELGVTDAKMAGRVVGVVMKAYKGQVEAAEVKRIAEAELVGG